jgi:hypothetical protein
MSTPDNGGPAFPCDVFDPDVKGPEQHEGMSLRDYFAAKALGYMVGPDQRGNPERLASNAYRMADAMLKARSAS